jgi:hypothetical protein
MPLSSQASPFFFSTFWYVCRGDARAERAHSEAIEKVDFLEQTKKRFAEGKVPPCDDPTKYCGFCCKMSTPKRLLTCACGNSGAFFFFVQDLLWVPSSFPVYLPKLQLGQLLLTCCIQAMRAA